MQGTNHVEKKLEGSKRQEGEIGFSEAVKQEYYVLPDGRKIPIDPANPEEARSRLPGEVIGEFTVDEGEMPLPLEEDPLYKMLQEAGIDMNEGVVECVPDFVPSLVPFMDPSGIMNPAAALPIKHHQGKQTPRRNRWVGKAVSPFEKCCGQL